MASAVTTCAPSARPHASRLARTAATDAGERSTNTTDSAPRLRASIPSAPVPAKRSTNVASATSPSEPSELNSASRTLDEVGRTSRPAGASSRRPLAEPATTRITPMPAP